jgi:hypothetical protein
MSIFSSIEFSVLSFILANSVALRITARKKRKQDITPISLLSSQQLEEFLERGVVVIRNVLNAEEISRARKGECNPIESI